MGQSRGCHDHLVANLIRCPTRPLSNVLSRLPTPAPHLEELRDLFRVVPQPEAPRSPDKPHTQVLFTG